MQDATPEALSPESKAKSAAEKLAESLKAFQKLTDPKERKDYYDKHPELSAIYSPVNFHTA
jgi:hypothetical protein